MNIAQLLCDQAYSRPQAVALVDSSGRRERRVTFAGLEEAATRAAALLQARGLGFGDPILIFHPMSADLYIALGAIFRLGLVALFVDPSLGKEHIERCCELVPPRALLASPKAHLLRLTSPAIRRIPVKFATGRWVPGAVAWPQYQDQIPLTNIKIVDATAPALITFTSGSTGRPKAAVRTHGFLRTQHQVLSANLDLGREDFVLTTLPIFVLSHLAAGIGTLIPNVDIRHPGAVEAEPLLRQIDAAGVTCIEGSPAFVERIARTCREQGRTLEGIRRVYMGGAPVFPDLLEMTQRIAPHARVTSVYGSTEAEPIAHVAYDELSASDLERMVNGAGLPTGQPVAEISVRILPDRWGSKLESMSQSQLDEESLAAGEIGEIIVGGAHVLGGYLHGHGDEENKVDIAGTIWHRTGDAGYLDEQGRLWLLGRCAARIEDAYGTIYPFAVESAVSKHPQVRRAALVSRGRKRVLAVEVYEGDPGVEIREMVAWAHVDEVRILDHLPVDRRHNAKIDYAALDRLLQ